MVYLPILRGTPLLLECCKCASRIVSYDWYVNATYPEPKEEGDYVLAICRRSGNKHEWHVIVSTKLPYADKRWRLG
jgi:hypothetical protein